VVILYATYFIIQKLCICHAVAYSWVSHDGHSTR